MVTLGIDLRYIVASVSADRLQQCAGPCGSAVDCIGLNLSDCCLCMELNCLISFWPRPVLVGKIEEGSPDRERVRWLSIVSDC